MSEWATNIPAGVNLAGWDELRAARDFEGAPREFWPTCLAALAQLATAQVAVLVLREAGPDGQWKRVGKWMAAPSAEPLLVRVAPAVEQVAAVAATNQVEIHDVAAPSGNRRPDRLLGLRLQTGEDETGTVFVALFLLVGEAAEQAEEILSRLQLAADLPQVYQLRRVTAQARLDLVHYANALDLLALLNEQHRFLATAMTFCNELSSRHECSRVSLGWLKNQYIRVAAVSHIEKFEKKMEAVNKLEQAMEEALEQDIEVVYPAGDAEATTITRDHETFAREQGVDYICSLPVRVDHEPVGVVTCERSTKPFDEQDLRLLRLCVDLASRRLGELHRHDRWFGARWLSAAREKLGNLVGVEHTGAKVFGILGALALLTVVFGRMPYRVEAPFVLRTEKLTHVTAPFDGYIDTVEVRMGDRVAENDPLLHLDTRELLLEEAAARADLQRYVRESEKAEAESALADMRIANALADQARARLALVEHRLANSIIKAPFTGIVVEGDLRQRVGAPLRQGDLLFKVARTEEFYVECETDERDIHEIAVDASGQVAFASQPQQRFPVRVVRVEPSAIAGETGNTFIVRCAVVGTAPDWWRPGMSGVAKVDAGRRSLLWIFTHRTVDFLRMFFWW